jgi:GNAT superfamily N-acetyltransferase
MQHRRATYYDVPALECLMEAAICDLMRDFLTAEQIAASFAIMGLDTRLIDDGTYFVIEAEGRLAGCGGWSRRATLFGGDHSDGRNDELLDPARQAARIRAMYTHPDFVRMGVGRTILARCEGEAASHGFRRLELAATMAGIPLYRACGYSEVEHFLAETPSGVRVPLARMTKLLTGEPGDPEPLIAPTDRTR